MTWYPNQDNRVSGIDQLTVVYDEFLYWDCLDLARCIHDKLPIEKRDDYVELEDWLTDRDDGRKQSTIKRLHWKGSIREQREGVCALCPTASLHQHVPEQGWGSSKHFPLPHSSFIWLKWQFLYWGWSQNWKLEILQFWPHAAGSDSSTAAVYNFILFKGFQLSAFRGRATEVLFPDNYTSMISLPATGGKVHPHFESCLFLSFSVILIVPCLPSMSWALCTSEQLFEFTTVEQPGLEKHRLLEKCLRFLIFVQK